MADPTEGGLVERARGGDLDAFGRVVRRHQTMAVGYAWSILGDYHAAEDAAQEAFVSAWLFLDSLREPSAFVGWLRRLVFTQCNRQQRRKTLKMVDLGAHQQLLPSQAPLPDTDLEREEQRNSLVDAVGALSKPLQETVMLYYFGEHSQKEIAAFLGVPVSTIGKRLHDARAKLRTKVKAMQLGETVGEQFTRHTIDRVIAIPFSSTLLGTVVPALQATSCACSWARAAGVLGHAFTFSMLKGCGECRWEGNIDWWLYGDRLDDLGYSFNHFEAIQTIPRFAPLSEEALRELKATTWTCVRAAIDRGVPAIAWAPMTLQQKEDGAGGCDWGLLVGYDDEMKTYVVRHPVRDNVEYEVPYDGFGHCDPVSWYCVMVPKAPVHLDAVKAARTSLRDGIRFAEGTRYDPREACQAVDAEGFGAYELWQAEVQGGTASVLHAAGFARLLTSLRTAAADYVGELVAELPESTHAALGIAAAAYRDEVAVLESLVQDCERARQVGQWDPPARRSVADGIGRALERDRQAIAAVKEAVRQLSELEES